MIDTTRRRAMRALGALGVAGVGTTGVAAADHGQASVTFEDQSVHHGTVYVKNARVPDGGWLVVHHLDHGAGGAIVGVSAPLVGGKYTNLPVELGGYADLPTSGTHTLQAMPHRDDPHDGEFDFPGADPPYTEPQGGPVTDDAAVSFE